MNGVAMSTPSTSWMTSAGEEGLGSTTSLNSRPIGFDAIHAALSSAHPGQTNPLQVSALVKYWLGGPDPLDYISMYSCEGDNREAQEKGIPPHWHYVSFGLSDLHGDGRVHKSVVESHQPSGYGFELTFRLKKETGDTADPPTWPAELMQALARYVFHSENTLCIGDHVSWHASLDGMDSRIRHLLLAEDPQLPTVSSALGTVKFIQMVGVTQEELDTAQKWNVSGVLDLLKRFHQTGGEWHVTDMRRGESVFEIDPTTQALVEEGIAEEGSQLSGVSARCGWESRETNLRSGSDSPNLPPPSPSPSPSPSSSPQNFEGGPPNSENNNAVTMGGLEGEGVGGSLELQSTVHHSAVCLFFNEEAAQLLPLAIRGRLGHGRHFTYKSVSGEQAITLVCEGVDGSLTSHEHPYSASGPWLQVYLPQDFANSLLKHLETLKQVSLPYTSHWPEQGLTITILPEQ